LTNQKIAFAIKKCNYKEMT